MFCRAAADGSPPPRPPPPPPAVSICPTDPGTKDRASDSGPNADEGSSSDCLPCREGCAYCKDDTPCVAPGDAGLRVAVLSFQALGMLLSFISMVLVYRYRRNKVTARGGEGGLRRHRSVFGMSLWVDLRNCSAQMVVCYTRNPFLNRTNMSLPLFVEYSLF